MSAAPDLYRLEWGTCVDILLTDAARAVIDGRFRLRAMPPAPMKGVAAPVGTFAVEGFDEGTGAVG